MLPETLTLPNGGIVHLNKIEMHFHAWTGVPIADAYGNKAVLDVDGEPLFAELAILRELEKKGWHGVWVDTYRQKFRRAMPPTMAELPASAMAVLNSIVSANAGRRSGCFDVFVWKDNEFLFAESKRKGRDRIRTSQLRWLQAALQTGLPITSFRIVEWELVLPDLRVSRQG